MKRMIGARLEAAMQAKGWDQKKLAEAASVDPATVSRHLRDLRAPTVDIVFRYARALAIRPEQLLGTETPAERVELRESSQIQAERARRHLTPNATAAIDNFDWANVRVEEEQAITNLLALMDVEQEEDPPTSFWTDRIRALLRILGRI